MIAPSRRSGAAGAGYTWFVRVARLALPVAALVLVGVVVARLTVDPEQQEITALPEVEETKTIPGQIEIVKAKYEGVDAEGRAYTLTADTATRLPDDPNRILLKKPLADIVLGDGKWLAARAESGVYDTASQRLNLSGGIAVFHDAGYEAALQDIDIDIKARNAATARAVSAKGPSGSLVASRLEIKENSNLIVFGGPATLTLQKSLSFKGKGG